MKSMLNSAALHQVACTFPRGARTSTENRSLTIWRERCLLWQQQDLKRALAYFTFIADVTTLARDCRFAGDSETLVARYDGLPFAAIAFHSQGVATRREDTPRRILALTRQLVSPTETFYCLASKEDLTLLQDAYTILETHPEQQMMYPGAPSSLEPGDAVRLGVSDLSSMRALAQREGMMAFEKDPLSRGPWYGVWRDGQLVSQGGIHLSLWRAAEIGNIVTARTYRRKGLATQVVAALLGELNAEDERSRAETAPRESDHSRPCLPSGACPEPAARERIDRTEKTQVEQKLGSRKLAFLQVFEDNQPALSFYEHLGFRHLRTMYLVRCRV